MNLIQNLFTKNLISPPLWLPLNVHYLGYTGSAAYGVSGDTSDMDVYGFCIPPKALVFPESAGAIIGFDKQWGQFDQWQQHHITDQQANGGKGQEYDLTVYSIVKFFRLCADNNPNMIDALFLPRRCILYSTAVGEKVRENRHLFLHKGAWHKFKGYAYSQLHKIHESTDEGLVEDDDGNIIEKKTTITGKRRELIEKYGYDTKYAYHLVRLMLEIEQILVECDLDLERNSEQLKSIRRGEWTLEQIRGFFNLKETQLETAYHKSTLPYKPREADIKDLLIECLEMHYGSNGSPALVVGDATVRALKAIQKILKGVKLDG